MKRFVLCGALVAVLALGSAHARDRSAGLAAQYSELKRVESCAWRRVVQGPLYASPVGGFAFVIAWDCDIHEAQQATGRRVAFERRHRLYESSRGAAVVGNRGDTAWYPAGFR